MLVRQGEWFVSEGQVSEADLLSAANDVFLSRLKSGDVMSNPQDVKSFCKTKLLSREHEVFGILYLDNRHQLVEFEEMFRGTIDGASVHPREVVKGALLKNAAAVIFTHNHPSGSHEPSQADRDITTRLKDALALIDVRVLDHIIVGNECCSFAERGLI